MLRRIQWFLAHIQRCSGPLRLGHNRTLRRWVAGANSRRGLGRRSEDWVRRLFLLSVGFGVVGIWVGEGLTLEWEQ